MMSIELLSSLSTSHVWITHVDNNAGVSVLMISWRICWLMLSSNELANKYSNTSNWHGLCIEKMVRDTPCIYSNILRFLFWNRKLIVHHSFNQMVFHFWKCMPNIWVEWWLGIFCLSFELWELIKGSVCCFDCIYGCSVIFLTALWLECRKLFGNVWNWTHITSVCIFTNVSFLFILRDLFQFVSSWFLHGK